MEKGSSIEELFLGALGSESVLKWYLEKNIDVLKYLQQTHKKFLIMMGVIAGLIPKIKREEIMKDFNSKRILFLLEKNRPELYKILINCSWGRDWLDHQILNFRKKFL